MVTRELFWLACTATMTALFWLPYILNSMVVRGVMGAMANPSPDAKPLAPWAQRAKAAHYNAVENLAVFATLVIVAYAAGITRPAVGVASVLYFWARLVHFVVYTAGIPVVRTLAFVVGFVAQIIVALVIFGLI